MAKRGSTKKSSVDHENFIADLYGGKRSPSSGASAHDQGDVRTELDLIECKTTGRPGYEIKPLPGYMKQFAKIADEAWSEGRNPVLALRFYNPDSPLSQDGWIDVVVRLATNDAMTYGN